MTEGSLSVGPRKQSNVVGEKEKEKEKGENNGSQKIEKEI